MKRAIDLSALDRPALEQLRDQVDRTINARRRDVALEIQNETLTAARRNGVPLEEVIGGLMRARFKNPSRATAWIRNNWKTRRRRKGGNGHDGT